MGGDASFTFLHRVEEVEQNIEAGRWQSALALALTLPDICGGIAFPEVVKRYRDGRVMLDRQNNPTRDVGSQYIRWFDTYAGEFFKLTPNSDSPYICGERCWQLRCEYLHQNKGFVNEETEQGLRFHLGVNCGTSVCAMTGLELPADPMDIRIDIRQFCLRMCRAARSYYEAVHREKDFSLYHTPVLDFIQAVGQGRDPGLTVILCGDPAYGKGLAQIMGPLSGEVAVYHRPDRARKELGRRKPTLWIIAEGMLRQPDQPWRGDRTTPVILLTRGDAREQIGAKEKGRVTLLPLPIMPEGLRDAARVYLG